MSDDLVRLTLANVTPGFRREARFIQSAESGAAFEIVRWVDDTTIDVKRLAASRRDEQPEDAS